MSVPYTVVLVSSSIYLHPSYNWTSKWCWSNSSIPFKAVEVHSTNALGVDTPLWVRHPAPSKSIKLVVYQNIWRKICTAENSRTSGLLLIYHTIGSGLLLWLIWKSRKNFIAKNRVFNVGPCMAIATGSSKVPTIHMWIVLGSWAITKHISE